MAPKFPGLLLVALLAACSSARPSADAGGRASRVEAPQRASGPSAASASGPEGQAAAQVVVAPPSGDVPETAFEFVTSLRDLKTTARASSRPVLEGLVRESPFAKTMTATLDARGWDFFFSTPTGPARSATLLFAAVHALPAHGRTTEGYPLDLLGSSQARLLAAAPVVESARRALEGTKGWEGMREVVERETAPTEAEIEALVEMDRMEGKDADGFAAVDAALRRLIEAEATQAKARADLEVACMTAFFRYALDMRFLVAAHPFKADANPAKAPAVHAEELAAAFETFARDPQAGLDAFVPKHPYYAKAMAGLAAYRKMAAEGPFPELKTDATLKKGSKGALVRAVKERLAREGYFTGVIDDRFDADLEKSVMGYQRNHAYDATGILEKRHFRSMNIPVDKRVKQIELSLQRWRESEVPVDEPLYVRVNIAEFHMEVWENGLRALKHKVVVGNNNWDKDTDNRIEGRINRTKLFKAAIERVLLNPKWHVPGRIQREELNYELLAEPDYYAKHNFKVKILPDGREEIYQDSGKENALGRVKFQFPNRYGIFMHDTNVKSFFQREVRAFSHGCVRLSDPLVVAHFILERRAGMTAEQIDSILSSKVERDIALSTPVPIVVEYNTVGVDDDGRMQFFSDPYEYDKDFFAGKIPYSEEELKLLMKKIPKGG